MNPVFQSPIDVLVRYRCFNLTQDFPFFNQSLMNLLVYIWICVMWRPVPQAPCHAQFKS